jgi:peptidylprolyl isomerase
MPRRITVVTTAVALLLLAASCTTDDTTVGGTTTTPSTQPPIVPCLPATDIPEVEGKPAVEMPAESVRELQVEDLVIGEGTELTAEDSATVHYVGVACSTGLQFDSTWDEGMPIYLAGRQVIDGLSQGLIGMRVGGRRQLVIPPELGYGSVPRGDIGSNETLVFVVDLVEVTPPKVSVAGQPCVEATDIPEAEGKPDIEIEPGPPPTEVVVQDIEVGTGDEITPQSSITFHYLIVACSTGRQWDSTWDRGSPVEIPYAQLQPGAAEGMAGMREGGRRLIVLPADKAYGSTPPADSPLQLDESLFYVVELIDVGGPTVGG